MLGLLLFLLLGGALPVAVVIAWRRTRLAGVNVGPLPTFEEGAYRVLERRLISDPPPFTADPPPPEGVEGWQALDQHLLATVERASAAKIDALGDLGVAVPGWRAPEWVFGGAAELMNEVKATVAVFAAGAAAELATAASSSGSGGLPVIGAAPEPGADALLFEPEVEVADPDAGGGQAEEELELAAAYVEDHLPWLKVRSGVLREGLLLLEGLPNDLRPSKLTPDARTRPLDERKAALAAAVAAFHEARAEVTGEIGATWRAELAEHARVLAAATTATRASMDKAIARWRTLLGSSSSLDRAGATQALSLAEEDLGVRLMQAERAWLNAGRAARLFLSGGAARLSLRRHALRDCYEQFVKRRSTLERTHASAPPTSVVFDLVMTSPAGRRAAEGFIRRGHLSRGRGLTEIRAAARDAVSELGAERARAASHLQQLREFLAARTDHALGRPTARLKAARLAFEAELRRAGLARA